LARRSNSTGDKLRNVPHCGPDSRIHPDQAAKPRFAQEQAMNKAEFVDAVADAAELSKMEAARAVDAMVGAITKALKKGDAVTLVGFGTFQVRDRGARTGRNPRTGDTINIAASKNPTFKAGKALRDAVN
jgi:DNA-binding protein HU-beta